MSAKPTVPAKAVYSVLYARRRPRAAFVSDFDPAVLGRAHLLIKGRSRLGDWPAKVVLEPPPAALRISAGAELDDAVACSMRWLIVNQRFRDLLASHCAPDELEFLPVSIRAKRRGRPTPGYFIANPLRLERSVDWASSDVDRDAVDHEQIASARRVVLLDEVRRSGPVAFRMAELPALIAVRTELAQAMVAANITGIGLRPIEDMPRLELGRPVE